MTRAQTGLRFNAVASRLAAELGRPPSLEELALHSGLGVEELEERLALGSQAVSILLSHNQGLVVSVARRYMNMGMDLIDLVQEGCSGLVRSLEKFDLSRGFRFSTYAHFWIRQACSRALADQSRTVRLPQHVGEAVMRVKSALRAQEAPLADQASMNAVGRELGLPGERVRELLLAARHVASFEAEVHDRTRKQEGTQAALGDSLVAAQPKPTEEALDNSSLAADLRQVLNTLEPRERNVLSMHFGLASGCTGLSDLGATYGLSRERIRQIEESALRKLRQTNRSVTLTRHLSRRSGDDGLMIPGRR